MTRVTNSENDFSSKLVEISIAWGKVVIFVLLLLLLSIKIEFLLDEVVFDCFQRLIYDFYFSGDGQRINAF